MKYLIYGLFDPRDGQLRYIGKSSSGLKRPQEHLRKRARNEKTHKSFWVNQLINENLKPEIEVLEIHSDSKELAESERFWIAYYRGIGCNLTNITAGGDGGGYKGRVTSEETKQKLRMLALKQWSDPEMHKRMVENMELKVKSPEIRAKISNAKTGKRRSEKDRIAMSRGAGGRPFKDQFGNIYNTINGCARQLKVPATEVSKVLKGRANHTHKYVFTYIED